MEKSFLELYRSVGALPQEIPVSNPAFRKILAEKNENSFGKERRRTFEALRQDPRVKALHQFTYLASSPALLKQHHLFQTRQGETDPNDPELEFPELSTSPSEDPSSFLGPSSFLHLAARRIFAAETLAMRSRLTPQTCGLTNFKEYHDCAKINKVKEETYKVGGTTFAVLTMDRSIGTDCIEDLSKKFAGRLPVYDELINLATAKKDDVLALKDDNEKDWAKL